MLLIHIPNPSLSDPPGILGKPLAEEGSEWSIICSLDKEGDTLPILRSPDAGDHAGEMMQPGSTTSVPTTSSAPVWEIVRGKDNWRRHIGVDNGRWSDLDNLCLR